MDPRSLSFVTDACGGEMRAGAPDALVRRVCTDSRKAQPGDLFIPLAGEKFDGHDFLEDVAARGVAAVLVARHRAGQAARLPAGIGLVHVDDTRAALGRLAARYREDFDLPVVAIAGSNGKTTTKELLAAILREQFATLWNEASFNNNVGVPLTLLNLERTHQAAVLEVGTNHPGELAPLVRIIRPRLGIITSIGREHLEFFGDVAGVAHEEGWLAELLPADGVLILDGDSAWAEHLARRSRARGVTAGFGSGNRWRAGNVRLRETGTVFDVFSPHPEYSGEYRFPLVGRHQVRNALLALVAGCELGVRPDDARRGLAAVRPARRRLELWQSAGVRVLDDSYNANADSMIAALETLRDLPGTGRRLAVLGDMAELGPHTGEAHREVGHQCARVGLDQLIAVGRWAGTTAQAAREAGLADVLEFTSVEEAQAALSSWLRPGDTVLLKASRASALERLADAIRHRAGP
ncbi:MAG TPA: UDP-N-acetylmuramoyl-tripeptide--D-alanyl-D-alanine ligase [Methylomirabilota bacterium]|nr:UDP-N-acetylmuramoyl-tripeptide--D-alanyl-D-alanine ligase [Methylomirabilota bacterium]